MESTTAGPAPSSDRDSFGLLPIGVSTLSATENLDFSLYYFDEDDAAPRLYRDRDYPLRPTDIEGLKQRGVRTLYLSATDSVLYKRHVREKLDNVLKDESVPLERRFEKLQDAARQMLADSFEEGDSDAVVVGAAQVSNHIVSLVVDRQVVVSELLEVMYHDFNTCGHSFNVSTYCVLLGDELGVSEYVELEHFALGALLHDIGKLQVPPAILNKTTPLTEEEKDIVRRHPVNGFRELSCRDGIGWGQLMMAYQHHEQVNGDGYPVGLPGREIHPWARIVAVADAFDGMTCQRGQRRALALSEVIEHLKNQQGKRLDREIVQCWIAMIKAKAPKR